MSKDKIGSHKKGECATCDMYIQLTKREYEIVEYIPKGLSNIEIADILGLSVRTVKCHLEHVYNKLGFEIEPGNGLKRRIKLAVMYLNKKKEGLRCSLE